MNLIETINKSIAAKKVDDLVLLIMYENIGDIDPKLRDETIYNGFYTIFNQKLISERQKKMLLGMILVDNNLFIDSNDDAVFTRSFTSLLLAIILDDHYKNNWINEEDEKLLVKMAFKYMMYEFDDRGDIDDKGWAHAFAHGADFLDEAIKSKFVNDNSMNAVIDIYERIFISKYHFTEGEEGRLVIPLVSYLEKIKSYDKITKSLEFIAESIQGTYPQNKQYNLFLMNLYFTLNAKNIVCKTVTESIENILFSYFEVMKVY